MQNRHYLLLILLVSLSSILLISSEAPTVSAIGNFEDFTTYVEVDPNSRITENATRISFTQLTEEENASVYIDKGTGYFSGDFQHEIDMRIETDNKGEIIVWALWNDNGSKAEVESSSNGIFVRLTYIGAPQYDYIYLEERYNNNTYITSWGGINYPSTRYLYIERVDSELTLKIYSDKSRNTLTETLSLTLQSIESYRYLYGLQSWGSGGTANYTGYVENLHLGPYNYQYTFKGVYDETTGSRDGAVDVTAYYEGQNPQSFTVDETYIYRDDDVPLYFSFDLDSGERQYWLSSSGENGTDIYIFNGTFTDYTIFMLDFAGILDDYSFVSAKRHVNGTLYTMEKRQADINDKVVMNLISDNMYNIVISDDLTYNYGWEWFGVDTTVEIVSKGIEFPQEIILAYRYVRMYAIRRDNYSAIDLLYHDLDDDTDHVDCRIKYANGTIANQTTLYINMFNYTWTSAQYNITYYVEMDAFHNDYGELNHRQVMYRGGFGISPWKLEWLGTISNMETTTLIPIFLIFAAALAFSKVNAYMGAFLATLLAILFTWWGWLNISASMLIMALVFTILMALGYKKKRTIGI